MSERVVEKHAVKRGKRFITSIVLFVLAGVMLVCSISGYVLRGSASTRANLDRMRTSAVLHAATEGLVDSIAQTARSAKLKEQETALIFHELEEAGSENEGRGIFGENEEMAGQCAVIFKEEADMDAVLKAADGFAKKFNRNAAVITGTGEEKNFLIAGPAAQDLLKKLKEHYPVKGGGRGEMVRGRVRM